MSRRIRSWASAFAWAALLLFLASRPSNQLPSGGLWSLPGIDKVAHALVYGILGFLVVRAVGLRRALPALALGAAAGLTWGMLDEWVQSHVPGRTPAWTDLCADALGAAAGGWLRWRLTAPRPGSK